MNYIKGTDYVLISSLDDEVGFLRLHNHKFSRTSLMGQTLITSPQVLRFDLIKGPRDPSLPSGSISEITLMLYASQGRILVDKPKICFSACSGCSQLKMYHSGIKYCSACNTGLHDENDVGSETTGSFLGLKSYESCTKKPDCQKGEILHLKANFGSKGDTLYESDIQEDRVPVCRSPPTQPNPSKPAYNRRPGYSLTNYGVCLKCSLNEKSVCTSCFHPVESSIGLNCLEPNIYDFSTKKIEVSSTSEKRAEFEAITKKWGFVNTESSFYAYGAFKEIIPRLQVARLRDCAEYQKVDFSEAIFDLRGRRGFTVEFERVTSESDPFLLFNYSCFRVCGHGYYYSEKGMLCRLCPIGCAECASEESCDKCKPGWKRILNPESNKSKKH